jgi:hypothetical protein
MNLINALLSHLANRIATIGAAAASAALLAYFRAQYADGIKWLFDPIIRYLPWRRTALAHLGPPRSLSSELTMAEVFLLTPDGKHAIYAKTGNYVVGGEPLSSYFEGVTASANASDFSTELGAILETKIEHGFHISHIDLGSVLGVGARFHNVYRAQLDNSFTAEEEHWTQEIALPTKHLTLRIHFPKARPPVLLRCKRLFGLTEYYTRTRAIITELFGQPSVVWEIDHPKLGEIYKLEWRW